MTAICASHYRNPLNDYVGKKHHHQNRFRQRQSSRSAFYQPGLRVIESRNDKDIDTDKEYCCDENSTQQQQSQQQSQPLQSQDQITTTKSIPEGHWGFRPSALQYEDYGRGDMSVSEIVDWYVRDNERAEREGVAIPPRPSLSRRNQRHDRNLMGVRDALFSASSSSLSALSASTTTTNNNTSTTTSCSSSSSSSCSILRCLQWNIQAFLSPKDERNMHTITAGIIRSICATDADVMVLNEIHWRETEDYSSYHCERTKQAIQSSQALLEEVLRLRGYHFARVAQHGDTPTMIATRKKVLKSQEIILSDNRSALCLLIETSSHGTCWVVGTHLDAFDAHCRRSEISHLLQAQQRHKDTTADTVPIWMAGDFNQQRARDYTAAEWKKVANSADLRGVPLDDGVADLLEEGGFRCILDDVRTHEGDTEESDSTVACNWNQSQPPPSTHWSGTTIDYTYYSNPTQSPSSGETGATTTTIAPHGVYVGSAGFSDHRMTVTDWTVTTTTPAPKATTPARHIDKSFFFHHLPAGRHHSWLHCYNHHQGIPPPQPRSSAAK